MTNETANKATILIVDDTPLNLELLFQHLSQSGYEVLVAEDGKTAVHQAEHAQPDIILLDVMMPDMDGFETCKQLKARPTTKDIPVIFMTALSKVENKVKGFAIGAVDYVTKPFELREVLARIDTHLTLKRLQRNLEGEIAERLRIEEKLRRYTSELQEHNAELDAFSHTVAHNLKNSLQVLAGMAQLLALDYAIMPREDMKKHLEIIARSGRKALNIVDELLVLASVRQQEIEPQPLNMTEIFNEAHKRVLHLVEEYQAQITIPESWFQAWGYAPWVEEVWVNYLSNAIIYGGEPPVIIVSSTSEDDMVRFWITDNGPGIASEAQRHLFAPFTQLNELSIKGHGLGLSIVQRIVNKLGGEVAVHSKGIPGKGSTFSFTLPTGAGHRAPPAGS